MSPPAACQEARDDLVACLLRTDCVLKSGKTPNECLHSPQELPVQCQHLIARFADCKKGILDMRRRFRGNHLSETAKEHARGRGFTGDNTNDPLSIGTGSATTEQIPDRLPEQDKRSSGSGSGSGSARV